MSKNNYEVNKGLGLSYEDIANINKELAEKRNKNKATQLKVKKGRHYNQ